MIEGSGKTLASMESESDGVRRVLIVDDDLDFAETIADILEPMGYEVALAHSSAEACEAAKDFPAAVALLDIRLGSTESGIQLIGKLKDIRPKVMCIMMTGFAALETAIQALKDGAYDYLRKPVSPADLFATLGRCFGTVELVEAKHQADEALQVRNQELDTLNRRMREVVKSAQRLTACQTLDELGPLMLKEFAEAMDARGGSLFLVEENHLQRMHFQGQDYVPERLDFPLQENSIFWYAFRDCEALLITDLNQNPKYARSGWKGYEDNSILVFPILDHEQRICALLSMHDKKTPPFTEQDKELGKILASLCAELLRSMQATEALVEEERRFREMADLLPAIVYEIGLDREFSFINEQAVAITGYSREELNNGFQAIDLFCEEDRPRLRENMVRLLEGEELGNNDYTLQCKNGDTIQVLARSAPVFRGGKVVGIRGFIFDISDRIHAERHRAQLAMAVDQAAEVILILDGEERIQYINPVYHFLTGIKPSERLGMKIRDILSEDHNEDFFESVWDTLHEGNIWAGRLDTRRENGSTYESEATISPLRNDQGEIVNYVAILRDISHETTLEKRLRQAEKLEAIGTLAGGIAHDFNNILSPIIGFTEIVREDLPIQGESRRNLDKVLNACYMARELVRRILTFSRQAEAERKPVEVKQVLKEALKLLRPSIPSTIAIRTDFDNASGSVYADPTQIHQVIMNLCTNAYQAMQDKAGTLTIRLLNQFPSEEVLAEHPKLQPGRDHIVLVVQDTGMGMTKNTLDRIFDPFFSTKEMGKGTGLGLATVHGIVMEMGGEITVQSEVERGTTITVYMPRYDIDEKRKERKAETTPIGSRERILFVDDEEMILQLGEKMLSRLGYQVEVCTGSKAGLDRFGESPQDFDLVITDQTMPGMTGQDLAARLKTIRPDIPIILITGFSSVLDMDHLGELGISKIVHKPFTRNDIGNAIQTVLHGSKN
ncbi:MAG: response regulator [Acidobacteriota bacterium]|nr:response regulator [Acidobacteriota bacterium]